MSAETRGHTERGAVERAAEVIAPKIGHPGYWKHAMCLSAARALADAGLLLTDVDRAVLDAYDAFLNEVIRAGCVWTGGPEYEALMAAGRARRDAS